MNRPYLPTIGSLLESTYQQQTLASHSLSSEFNNLFYNNSGYSDNCNSIIINNDLSNKISILQHSFNAYKNDLIHTKELDNDCNEEEIQFLLDKELLFLQNIIDVKKRISILKKKYTTICDETILIKEYIEKLEKLKINIEETNKDYINLLFIVSKELNPNKDLHKFNNDYVIEKQKNNIIEIILYNNNICKDNDEKCCNIIEKIKLLQDIICVKDIDNIDKNIGINSSEELVVPIFILCTICLEKNIDYCINPCGHCFCKSCINKLTSKCHICRGLVKEKIKLYVL